MSLGVADVLTPLLYRLVEILLAALACLLIVVSLGLLQRLLRLLGWLA